MNAKMTLVSVNSGVAQQMAEAKVNGQTGIFKVPVSGDVAVETLGLQGDAVCDTKNHGGPDQAVYVFGTPEYAWWTAELGTALAPGTFGENLTIDGFESAAAQIGDRFQIGDVILEISSPRIPCHVLAKRMEDAQFVKRFRAAERPGAYCRVITPGLVRAGMPVAYRQHVGPTIALLEMYRDFYKATLTPDEVARHLAAPIAIRDREALREKYGV
jgi:MOSC domain-containing protein YiiM